MEKILSEEPARELSSREIAKVLGGLLGGLANFCKPEDIKAAITFTYKNIDVYTEWFNKLKSAEVKGFEQTILNEFNERTK